MKSNLVTAMILLGLSSTVEAKKTKKPRGVLLQITVLDKETQSPVSTATVIHSAESAGMEHKVNQVNGVWKDDAVFLSQEKVIYFTPKSSHEFTIQADGYDPLVLTHEMRRWGNKVVVELKKKSTADTEVK